MYISAYDLREDIKNLDTSRYFYFWKKMLQTLFDLPEQSIYAWAARLREELFADRSDNPERYHPIDAITHLFVTRGLLKNGIFKYYSFIKKITDQIEILGDFADINYDYDAAQKIVIAELNKHNAELPEVNNDNLVTRKEWYKSHAEEMLSQYIPFWKAYFREILGIHEQRSRYLLLRYQKRLEHGSVIAYQDGPAYDVIDVTIQDELIYRMDINWFAFREKIFEIIDDEGRCRTTNYDFPKTKNRLIKFLSEYDSKINSPCAMAVIDKTYLTAKHCVPFVLRFISNLLVEVLGWSKERILKKATSEFKELRVECPYLIRYTYTVFFFKGAGPSCAVSLLLDELFGNERRNSIKAQELYYQMGEAIAEAAGESGRPAYEPDYDFKKVGAKIKRLIKPYREGC